NQSRASTKRIWDVLTQIDRAIRSAVSITEEGQTRMDQSLKQAISSGENLRGITEIVRESTRAARQIAASVSQQHAGISQVSEAIVGISDAMEETDTIRLAASAASA